jgi:hypothetical protein
MPASTVHAVLVRCRLNRLSHIDRVTGEPARRYERQRPGELIHVDVKKLGNIPDGGGWRYLVRSQGDRNRQATRQRTGASNKYHQPKVGTCFVHTVIDDYTRIAPSATTKRPRPRCAGFIERWPGSPDEA